MSMRKILLVLLVCLSMISVIGAYQFSTVYNPYTGKQDFFQTENYSGYNLTANYFCLSGSCIQSWPSGITGNPFDQGLNTTQSVTFAGLTLNGQLIMNSLIKSQNIMPAVDNLYSIGNSTNRFKDLYAVSIYSTNISSTYLNSTNIDTRNITSLGGQDIVVKLS